MAHMNLKRLAFLALFACAPAARAQIVMVETPLSLPWTKVVALDAPDAARGWSVVVSSPPPDAIEPPGGFPVLYYLDDEMSLLFTDTARRLGGSKRQVVLAGLRPGPRAVRDGAGWARVLKHAVDIIERMHPGKARCSISFVRPADRAMAIMPSGNGALQINGYAVLDAGEGRTNWRMRYIEPEANLPGPTPSTTAFVPDMPEETAQMHSRDELLALPEGIARAVEWASSCRPR